MPWPSTWHRPVSPIDHHRRPFQTDRKISAIQSRADARHWANRRVDPGIAAAGPARVRAATWGDLARVSALYNQPTLDWLIKDYPRRVFRDQRYEGHFRQGWLAARAGRGHTLVLENPLRRIVGISCAIEGESFFEQHVLTFDCWACPAYLPQLPDLIAALVEQAATGATEVIQTWVAASDGERQSLLSSAGFREEARLANCLRLGNDRDDLLVYALSLNRRMPPARPPSAYYGARPAFRDTESPGAS